MRKIKVEMLTEEAFAPYGKIISPEGREDLGALGSHSWFPQVVVREEPTSVNLMEVFPKEFVCKKFEAHDHTEETLIAMTGGVIVPVMPKDEFNVEHLKAFYVPKGTGICCAPGVWHFAPYVLGESVWCTVIFKNNTSHDDIYFKELDETIGMELA